jgi:hypothetical protein
MFGETDESFSSSSHFVLLLLLGIVNMLWL